MEFKHVFLPVAVGGVLLLGSAAFSQVRITKENGGVVVKTATDTLRLTVCSSTSIHVVASPDGSDANATPKQPWLVQRCQPQKFTLTMPPARTKPQSENSQLSNAAAVVDTGALKVRITQAWGNLEFQDEQGHRLLQEFQDAPRNT